MGSIFGIHRLHAHPSTPADSISDVSVNLLHYSSKDLVVEFSVVAEGSLLLPELDEPKRMDKLWSTTCFEVFLADEAGRYVEFNLSPSTAWAAYAFDTYRKGMRDLAVAFYPEISVTPSKSHFFLYAELPNVGGHYRKLAFSAVIEEIVGTKSYWALNHPPGKPDFHHRDCFALQLAPPEPA